MCQSNALVMLFGRTQGWRITLSSSYKTSPRSRLDIIENVSDAYGISVHYSNRHYNYYSAWRYVTKSDACYIKSEGHPCLDDTEPQTSSVSRSRRQRQKRSHGNTTNSEISSAGDEEEDFTQQRHLSGFFPHCCEGFTGQRAWKVQEYYVNRSSKLRENIFIEPTDNYKQHI